VRSRVADGWARAGSKILFLAIDHTELIALRITHVGEVHHLQAIFAEPWRIFDRFATLRDRGVMKCLNLLGRAALEGDGAAVCRRRLFAVDGFTYAEGASVMPVDQATVARRSLVTRRFGGPECAEHSIIKALRTLDVV
jgi:hypothetical protein